MSSDVALMLESALPFTEKSDVIAHWITSMLSPYFRALTSDLIYEYRIKSNTIFISLNDDPMNQTLIQRSMQSLQVYCSNRMEYEGIEQ